MKQYFTLRNHDNESPWKKSQSKWIHPLANKCNLKYTRLLISSSIAKKKDIHLYVDLIFNTLFQNDSHSAKN